MVNTILAVMAKEGQKGPGRGELPVYQVATSVANPLTNGQVAAAASVHFQENPFMLPHGQGPVRMPPMKLFKNPFFFALDIWFKYQLPLQVSQAASRDASALGCAPFRPALRLVRLCCCCCGVLFS